MKIALYDISSSSLPLIAIRNAEDEAYMHSPRVSGYIEVDFPPRPPEEVIPEQLAKISAQIADVDAQYARAIKELNERRQNLLALTDNRAKESV